MDDALTAKPQTAANPRIIPLDLMLVILLALVGAACVVLLPDGNALRVVLSIPLLLVYPGYALGSLLWPANNDAGKSIDLMERLALSFGLSIVVISIIGLGLSLGRVLDLPYVLAGNLAVLLVCSFLAFHRRSQLPAAEQFNPNPLKAFEMPRGAELAISAIIVAGILVTSGFITYAIVEPAPVQPFTEFYILDANATTRDYPFNLTANQTATVIVGIANHEMSDMDYTVTAGVENFTAVSYVTSWDNPILMANGTCVVRNVSVVDGATFQDGFAFSFAQPGAYKLVWQLEGAGLQTVYKVHIWVNVSY